MSVEKTNVAAVVQERETKIKRKKKKKIGNEIDEIFQGKKRKSAPADDQKAKDEGGKLDKVIGEGGSMTKDKKKRRKADLNEDSRTSGRRRRTTDGLAIYSADELAWGKADAGGTPLCPFDCSCCF